MTLYKCCCGPLIGWKVPATAGDIVELWKLQSATADDSRPLALATVASWSINTRAIVGDCRRAARLPATVGDWSINQALGQWRGGLIFPTVYPKKYAHGFCFAVLCCGYTLTDFPISNRLASLALWQSNDCPSASKATLVNMDKCVIWIHYERLYNHNKAKHNKTVCIFLGIYCMICVWTNGWETIDTPVVLYAIPTIMTSLACPFCVD